MKYTNDIADKGAAWKKRTGIAWEKLKEPQILFYFFLLILIVPNVVLSFTEPMPVVAKICNVLLPLGIYYVLISLSRSTGKMFWVLFPFLLLGAFQIVLLYLFGRSVIAVDMFLNLTTTNSGEAMELLDNLLPAIVLVILLYVPALVFAAASVAGKRKLSEEFYRRERIRALFFLLAGFLSLGAAYSFDRGYAAKTDLYPMNVCYNVGLAFERETRTRDYGKTSEGFTYRAVSSHEAEKREIYVMVVGETARAMNWELYGYGRPTNPELKNAQGVTAFPYVFTESNTTHKSVPMLLSPITAADFDSVYYRKSIITAFKEAGFRTAFFSNQRYNNSFIDFFGKEADSYDFIKEDSVNAGRIVYDDELLKLVNGELSKGGEKVFIVLHTYGSHFNYRERYPDDMSFFKPDTQTEAKKENRENLINAYDNTIRYTDRFLASLIRLLEKQQAEAALIYTSDHGEDIFDDRRNLFLHASPMPTYYQLHVPFLVWMSDAYRSAYPALSEAVEANRVKQVSSSASFFQTMLGLAGIETPYRNDTLSVASLLFREKPRVYLNDHNKACPLEEIERN